MISTSTSQGNVISPSSLSSIAPTTFKIRLSHRWRWGDVEHSVELRWLDDAIEWVVQEGYCLDLIKEVSFQQSSGEWRVFTRQEVGRAIALFQQTPLPQCE